MNRYWLIGVSLLALACGRPFDVKTAPGFVELEQQNTGYDFRATTPEGVVMSMRVEEAPSDKGADLDFWARAVTLQMRDVQGYALTDSRDVTSRDGTKGKQLRFGHDEGSKPYTYWVTVYVSQDRLFIVEAGGAQGLFEKWTPSLLWMHKSVRVQCSSWVAPVLASHTCNRW
jgi:hypothetical protein